MKSDATDDQLPPVQGGGKEKLRLWMHSGKGHYIGSTVIVYAESAEAAEPIIRAELVCLGLADEELDISEIEPCDGVIFSDNGDY